MSVEKKKSLLAKAIFSKYSCDDGVLKGWTARPIAADTYQVVRADGSTVDLKIGSNINGNAVVKEGNGLKIGEHSIFIGDSVSAGWFARPTKSKYTYRITSPNFKRYDVKIGETLPGFGVMSLNDHGNLIAGDLEIGMQEKICSLEVIVQNIKEKYGFKAFINYSYKIDGVSRKDTTFGIFSLSDSDNAPSSFSELVDGRLHRTALFWPSSNKKIANGYIRSLTTAIEERNLYYQIRSVEVKAKALNIDPSDIYGYDLNKEAHHKLNKESWDKISLSVISGKKIFRLDEPNLNHSNSSPALSR